MKRLSLYLFLILFTLQTPSLADDIRDFQIEGMSVGDSLLEHFSNKIIIEASNSGFYYPKSDKFITIKIYQKIGKYDFFQFAIKLKDKNYVIYSLEGSKIYQHNIKRCINEQKKILLQLKSFFPNAKTTTDNSPHTYDKSGKSFTYETYYDLKDGGSIGVLCYDWSEKLTKKYNWKDNLKVVVDTQEFTSFLTKEAYK